MDVRGGDGRKVETAVFAERVVQLRCCVDDLWDAVSVDA